MKEIVYDIKEFKAKVDKAKPVHHCAMRKSIDQHGIFYRIIFRVYGIDKNNGHVLIFEAQKRTTVAELEQHPKDYQKTCGRVCQTFGFN